MAAVEGFGDQVVDIGNLVADIASGAWEVANEIVDDPLAWFKGKLESAVSTLEKGLEMMRNIDQVIKGLQDLWTNHQKYIDELKNGIGQELYNQYVAPIECGPIDTMRLITQNVSPAAPARVVVVFNKLRAVMKLPELPTNPPGDGKPGDGNPDRDGDGGDSDGDGNGNNPDAPGGLIAGKDRDGDGRDDDTGIVCDISGGPARSSFRAGTPVLTPEGLKPIESLQVGDLVKSRSDVDFSEAPQRITETFHRVAPGYWHLRLETKRFLDVTAEHPIWQQGKGWVETQHYDEMRPAAAWGDDLMITHKTWVEGPVPVFNFSVEHTPSYFAGQDSLWVHNASGDADPNGSCPIRVRLPRTNGNWTSGEPGNGLWQSDIPEVNAVTGGNPIEFKNGRPDFSPWSKGEIEFEPGKLNGTREDFNLVYDEIAREKGLSSRNAAREYLLDKGLTPHHLSNTTIQLIPTDLHGNIPHIGSASDMRGEN
jgi:hypothetical protein